MSLYIVDIHGELEGDYEIIKKYEEPTTKIDCDKTDCNNCVNHKYCDYEPTTKNNLGVDLISREQAKTAIRDKFKDLPSRVEINTILNELPSVTPQEPRWIPCSERLPEDSGEYLVTVIDEDVETYKHTGIAWYAHPKDYDVEEGDWRELMIDEKVIAWMPLLKAYSEVEK